MGLIIWFLGFAVVASICIRYTTEVELAFSEIFKTKDQKELDTLLLITYLIASILWPLFIAMLIFQSIKTNYESRKN